jgi:hypothetical protein
MSHLEPEPGPPRGWLAVIAVICYLIGIVYGLIGVMNANNNPGLALNSVIAAGAFFVFGAALTIMSLS